MNESQNTAAAMGRKPRQNRRAGVGTGTTSLLMIFTVLCFATLAMLSLSTAVSNQRIQERGLARAQSLAAAKGEAAMKVADLDAGLLALDAAGYEDAAMALATAQGWQADAETGLVSLQLPIDENNELLTEIRILPQGGARYELVRQVQRLIGGWVPEDEGELWQG